MSKLEELPKESLIAEIEQLREDYKVASDALRQKEKEVKLLKDKLNQYSGIDKRNDKLIEIIDKLSSQIGSVNCNADQW